MTPATGQAAARPRTTSRAPAPRPPASRYASAQFDPHPTAPARARRFTGDILARWNMHALTDDAQEIASELITNAITAVPPGTTGLTVIYAIHHRPPGLRIYAWDIGPGHPRPATADTDAETGRGLAIIDTLTNRNWGWWPTPHSGGKVVWAALPTTGHTQDTA